MMEEEVGGGQRERCTEVLTDTFLRGITAVFIIMWNPVLKNSCGRIWTPRPRPNLLPPLSRALQECCLFYNAVSCFRRYK